MDIAEHISRLLQQPVPWLTLPGPESEIAICTRIRIARNISGIPFPSRATTAQSHDVIAAVGAAVRDFTDAGEVVGANLGDLKKADRQALFERHLISREHQDNKKIGGIFFSPRESSSIMVNEEDHVRLQVLRSGLQLSQVWSNVEAIDRYLSGALSYAQSPRLGYLTACPSNVGTGLRASVMVHLPALVFSEKIGGIVQGVNRLGMTVRGLFGEGSDSIGNLFQISNQSTLGHSETEIISHLDRIIREIIGHERNARQLILEENPESLFDYIGRSYGMLRHSYLLGSKETLMKLSAVRLGIDLKMFTALTVEHLNELIVKIQPAHLQRAAGSRLNAKSRAVYRAEIIREMLNEHRILDR